MFNLDFILRCFSCVWGFLLEGSLAGQLRVLRNQASQPFGSQYRSIFSLSIALCRASRTLFQIAFSDWPAEFSRRCGHFEFCRCPRHAFAYFFYPLRSANTTQVTWQPMVCPHSLIFKVTYFHRKCFSGIFSFATLIALSVLIQVEMVCRCGEYLNLSLCAFSQNPSPTIFDYRNLTYKSYALLIHLQQEANGYNVSTLKYTA